MPIHLPPISRRTFLGQAAAAGASFVAWRPTAADETQGDPNTLALLADTHIPSDPETGANGVNMTANLRQVVGELIAHRPKLSGVVVNGDCAYLKGIPGDYRNLAGVVQPLSEAGLPLHLTMGNHDDRGSFYEALAGERSESPPVESKHVSVLETPKANWFLLDSLFQVDVVTGELGGAQLEWLAKALDARADKPAILVAHHNPQFKPGPNNAWGGLKDAKALFDLVADRKQVKAYIFGHTHEWRLSKMGDVHLVNLPPVAYVFQQGRPNGWVEATLRDDGMQLKLSCLDKSHPQHNEIADLKWRS
jgi:3',5'-cyclic AMP phosphodiesterase CpdA